MLMYVIYTSLYKFVLGSLTEDTLNLVLQGGGRGLIANTAGIITSLYSGHTTLQLFQIKRKYLKRIKK